ncbi:hypothetical protein CONLIGDRAFT_138086 [Coniochaeta ligniaria NRRL 30616]|uniref:Uncharacterized protein n=1 Tax=Coniochaeta ligniaria NRRL 30616 TaxID=1408157 RepID=A0A1J7I7N1_9PEZI|nr:hypothetical protein CONLIGDRAFT_138086 [Coniochaeta ligniaria NRRL 30616]
MKPKDHGWSTWAFHLFASQREMFETRPLGTHPAVLGSSIARLLTGVYYWQDSVVAARWVCILTCGCTLQLLIGPRGVLNGRDLSKRLFCPTFVDTNNIQVSGSHH